MPPVSKARPAASRFPSGSWRKQTEKSDGDEYAELVNGDHDAGGAILQSVIIAEPRQSGGETGEEKKKPVGAVQGPDSVLFARCQDNPPCQQKDHAGADGGCEI